MATLWGTNWGAARTLSGLWDQQGGEWTARTAKGRSTNSQWKDDLLRGVMHLGQLWKIKTHQPRNPSSSDEAGFSKQMNHRV